MLNWFRKKKKNVEETYPSLNDSAKISEPQDQDPDETVLVEISTERLTEIIEPDFSPEPESEAMVEIVSNPEPEAVVILKPEPTRAPEAVTDLATIPAEEALPGLDSGQQSQTGEDSDQKQDQALVLPVEDQKQGLFARFKNKLTATRDRLSGRLENLLSSVRSIDEDLLEELEELLITSDLGVQTTEDLLFKIRGQVAKKELKDSSALKDALKKAIQVMMEVPQPVFPSKTPLVIMVVGINGVGKTTTIAKLAYHYINNGQKVLLAAGDTFRSAAVEQLDIWATRLGAEIVSQPTGSDASAVVFDALTAAQARNTEVVIVDTAGRLHTKVNLMDELKKIKRVAGKALPGAPHHTILVLDGNTGQNAQRQAQTFHEAVGIDSIIMTKLDGTSKGGVIVSITNELKIPITYVGLGESLEDLVPFDSLAFTEAILGK